MADDGTLGQGLPSLERVYAYLLGFYPEDAVQGVLLRLLQRRTPLKVRHWKAYLSRACAREVILMRYKAREAETVLMADFHTVIGSAPASQINRAIARQQLERVDPSLIREQLPGGKSLTNVQRFRARRKGRGANAG